SAARAAIDRARAARVSSAELAALIEALAASLYAGGSSEATEAAERFFARALALRESLASSDPEPLASLLHDLSSVAFNKGDFASAERLERRALGLRERALPPGDPRTAESRRDLALIFMAQGRLRETAELLPAALEVIEASPSGDPRQIAAGRNYLAELYRLQGRYAEAEELLVRLVKEAETGEAAGREELPYLLNGLAGIHKDQGRLDEAETLLRRSLALRREAGAPDPGAVSRATLNLAELYRAQGKLGDAEPLYTEALALARESLGHGSTELLEFLNQLAVLHRERGRLDEAEPLLREALALAEAGLGAGHTRTAQSLLDLAELLRARGSCRAAEAHYRRAAAIREEVLGRGHPDVAEALAMGARCLAADPGRRAEARAALDRAVGILGRSEAHPEIAAESLALRSELRRGPDPAGARRDLLEAIRIVEGMRPHRGGGESVRAGFFGRHAHLYETLVRMEAESGDAEAALEAAERGRARTLLDQLLAARVGEADAGPARTARMAAARAELAELRERLAFEQRGSGGPHADRRRRVEELERRLDEAARSFRSLYDEARNASPAWRGAAAPATVTARSVQSDAVPRGGLVLLYELGRSGSHVLLVPPAPGRVEIRSLAAGPAEAAALGMPAGPLAEQNLAEALLGGEKGPGLLARLASPRGALRRGIGGLSGPGELEAVHLHALWRVLVPAEFRERVLGAAEVVIIPDGPLFLMPFEALVVEPAARWSEARFWIDAGPPARYAPSATFLRHLASRPGPRPPRAGTRPSGLTVSDPAYGRGGPQQAASGAAGARRRGSPAFRPLDPLPGTAAESAAVRRALEPVADVAVLAGARAAESMVRRELAGKRYLHIATHGLVEESDADLFAALALAPPAGGPASGDDDGYLHLFEIYDLDLDAELAVLSACSTNAGRVVAGEGIFALSRAFLVAGARRVVASQWPVDDDSTAALMGDLFRRVADAERAGGPLRAARALRDARLTVRRSKDWAHPFYWAPFVLTGLD
ncbi:MAG TPA: CHAT domain-containing tetratricopeptide repeat protein, partial [Candidatus Polarisedimenticolia bacterium]|nr:CHAT domain-containing tetratricopeptide repeat protein [Candidatus Polarisedimenticolia bacterium]